MLLHDVVDHFVLGKICDRHGIPMPCPFADTREFIARIESASASEESAVARHKAGMHVGTYGSECQECSAT